jgi:predicted AAA+ superfamily ATPase
MLFEIFMQLHGDRKVFFLDEIQNVPGWEMFVRRQQDAGYKFYLTGSNASLLSRELGTKLTGRNVRMELYPFSFREYLRFAGDEPEDTGFAGTKERAMLKGRFSEWLKNGGMPEFPKYKDRSMLKHAYEDIIYRDIAARYELKHVKALRELTLYFMSNIGGGFTYNSAAKFLGLGSMNTVKNYFDYLENSYLAFFSQQVFMVPQKTVFIGKKIYCVDNGLADAVAFKFSSNRGKYLENAVYMELRRRGEEIYYYKTENGLEVDFLTRGKKQNPALYQSCAEMSNPVIRARELRALETAMKELKLKKAVIITEDEEETIKSQGRTINVIPAYKWMLSRSI